jgi:hypothetical protein
MKVYGGVDVQIHIFLPSALDWGEWSVHAPEVLPPGKEPQVHIW